MSKKVLILSNPFQSSQLAVLLKKDNQIAGLKPVLGIPDPRENELLILLALMLQ